LAQTSPKYFQRKLKADRLLLSQDSGSCCGEGARASYMIILLARRLQDQESIFLSA
jgi:hypothetical protein